MDINNPVLKTIFRWLFLGLGYLLETMSFLVTVLVVWGEHAMGLIGLCLMSASFYDKRKVILEPFSKGEKNPIAVFRVVTMVLALIIHAVYWAHYWLKD